VNVETVDIGQVMNITTDEKLNKQRAVILEARSFIAVTCCYPLVVHNGLYITGCISLVVGTAFLGSLTAMAYSRFWLKPTHPCTTANSWTNWGQMLLRPIAGVSPLLFVIGR